MSEVRLTVEPRTEFGKGAARRTRRAGKIPAVLYGHGVEPRHLALPALEFARVIRENGQNTVLTMNVAGDPSSTKATELALTKMITFHPLKNYIEHVDLLVVQQGEQIAIDVPVVVVGQAGPGTLVTQELDTIRVEAEALNLPESLEVSIDGAEPGTQFTAAQIPLPAGSTLVTDSDALVLMVSEAPSEAAMEAGVDIEGAGMVEDKPDNAGA